MENEDPKPVGFSFWPMAKMGRNLPKGGTL